MADHTENSFRAAIHALHDVVAPAVDPDNPLATEQLQLVIGWLDFQRGRLADMHARHRSELRASLAMAEAVAIEAMPEHRLDLDAATEAARHALNDPESGHPELAKAAEALDNATSAAVRIAADYEPARRAAVERAVVTATAPWLTLQRAWFKPQGIEARSADLPELAQLLRG